VISRLLLSTLVSLGACFAAYSAEAIAASSARPFTADDLVSLKRVSSPQVSRDGRRIAFVVRESQLQANRTRTSVWLMELGAPQAVARRVTHSDASEWSPRWAPDGSGLYFISSRSGSAQIWRLPANAGEAHPVTAYPVEVESFAVSPDGGRLALTLRVFADCDRLACTAEKLAAAHAPSAPTGQLYDALFVRHWDSWKDGRLSMLFTAKLTSDHTAGEPVNVSRGVRANVVAQLGGSEEYGFSPDGSRLVFAARLGDRTEAWSTNFDLFEVAAEGNSNARNITTANRAWDAQPVFLANGDLAYLAMTQPGFEADRFRIMLREAGSGRTRVLAESWDRSVRRLGASHDHKSLLATADDTGQLSLFAIDPATGVVARRVEQGQVTEFAAMPSGAALVAWASLASPPDLFVSAPDISTLQRLTSVNAHLLASRSMGGFEQFTFAGWNDEIVHGYVVRPSDFEPQRKYPVAFIVHGGPQSSMQNQWNWRWNAQAFAGRGYAVILIDFHGSPGYGQRFTDSVSKDWGGKPLVDLRRGLAAAIARYDWLDSERVCSLGASFGGFMQNWIAVAWPDRFKCLVSHAGVFDMRMGAYATDELWFTEWENGGTYFQNPRGNEQFNPATRVANWRTPTLLTHGALDYRVPYLHGLAAFTALQRLGVESRFLYFPDENHWVSRPANSLQWYRTVLDWVDSHLVQGTRPP
jgi:dipeptidyl aminopeptidase/acylaminoacyl peptidase